MRSNKKLYVFEGPDGVGKSTLSLALAERIRDSGIQCVYLSFPGQEEGTLGNLVYQIHHDQKRLNVNSISQTSLQVLHVAAHIDAIENKIIPALNEGETVILDRFWWSTLIYGRVYGANSKSLKSMIELEKIHWGSLKPDVVFLITRKSPLVENTDISIWKKLRREYKRISKKESDQYRIVEIGNDRDISSAIDAILKETNKVRSKKSIILKESAPLAFSSLTPAIPTDVFNTYWRFAAERQEIFFRKIRNHTYPLTKDPILAKYKFTNAYRASDRVSQYLIRNVIYAGPKSPVEVFFRILLFKIFNRIDTWEYLLEKVGTISYARYSFKSYDRFLMEAMSKGESIYSAAYIMTSGRRSFGYPRKHQNHLKLLELMIEDGVPYRITELKSMKELFELLRFYPTIGDFLAYQYSIDINYSELTNFNENEFVVPGPGAKDGIHKCFSSLGGLNEVEIIKQITERQEIEFERLGLSFKTLWGRSLHLIDCQNLFCEVDKYARIAHPEIKGLSNRTRIKQKYFPNNTRINYWYPPKWEINNLIISEGGNK